MPAFKEQLLPIKETDVKAMLSANKSACEYPWTLAHFQGSLLAGHSGLKLVLVNANGAERLIAFIIYMVVMDEAHLLNLVVEKRFQGKGQGRMLLRTVIELLKVKGIKRIFLDVRSHNKKAVKLYISEGFKIMAVRKNYYPTKDGRDDALVMSAEVDKNC